MDWYGGAWIGPIVAFLEIIVVAWIYGKQLCPCLKRLNCGLSGMLVSDIEINSNSKKKIRFSSQFPISLLIHYFIGV